MCAVDKKDQHFLLWYYFKKLGHNQWFLGLTLESVFWNTSEEAQGTGDWTQVISMQGKCLTCHTAPALTNRFYFYQVKKDEEKKGVWCEKWNTFQTITGQRKTGTGERVKDNELHSPREVGDEEAR